MTLLRYTARKIRHSLAFSIVLVSVLALGIGSAALLFGIVKAVLFRELPYRDPDSLVWIWSTRTDRDKAFFSLPNLNDYQMQNHTLQEIAAYALWGANLTGTQAPRRLQGVRVTANALQMLGVQPLRGRILLPQDDDPQSPNVVLLAHHVWQELFGEAQDVVGKVVILNGEPFTVAGILPPHFLFPGAEVDMVAPLKPKTDTRRSDRGTNFLRVFARLKPGRAIKQVSADMAAITERLKQQYPDENGKFAGPRVLSLREELLGSFKTPLLLLQVSVLLVLLIAALNFANLTFVRSWTRRQEVAIRSALGASRMRLVLEIMSESMATALLGGLLGLFLAQAGLKGALMLLPVELPRASAVSIDFGVILFCFTVALLIGIGIGLSPAIAVISSAQGISNTARSDSRPIPVRNMLVILQIGLSLFLVLTAVLLLKSFHYVNRIDPGFDASRVLTLRISLTPERYPNIESVSSFYLRLAERWQSIPGVESVALTNVLPLSKMNSRTEFVIVGRPPKSPDDKPAAQNRWVSANYFRAMKIPLLRGRMFAESDRSRNQNVVVVDEALATKFFPNENPIGKHIRMQLSTSIPEIESEIIGVVRTVKHFTLEEEPTATLYSPFYQIPEAVLSFFTNNISLAVRTAIDPEALAESVRRGLIAEDPNLPASFVRTMDSWLEQSRAVRRFQIRLLIGFASLALIVSLSGVYALVFYIVVFRWRELAIRMAVGAAPKRLVTGLVQNICSIVLIGTAVGLSLFVANSRFISGLLYEVRPWDPATVMVVAGLMVIVSAIAGYLPARKAATLDPAFILRSE